MELAVLGIAFILFWLIVMLSHNYLKKIGFDRLVSWSTRIALGLGSWLISREPPATTRSRLRILTRHRR